MEGTYFFEPNTVGWNEAWTALDRFLQFEVGQNGGRRRAYQALKEHCRGDNQGIPSEGAKRLMQIVLDGLPAGEVLTVMESRVLPGERWQYLGSFRDQTTGAWKHEFRHRHSDLHGGRAVFHFPCWTPIPDPVKPTVVVVASGFQDNGDPF